jgi:outer membrane protein OmpA-like peptidoglycan-associated protein
VKRGKTMRKTILSLLLLSAAIATAPAHANYFSNPALGMNLNIGSAPNPTPAKRKIIVEEQATIFAAEVAAPTPQPAPAPPPAPLIVAEAPPPPPVVRQFVVFFDFDRSNLSPEAMQVVGAAVMTAKDSGMAKIVVTGHTDTVGSQRYNQALSERRANSVKTELVRMGLNASDVETIGKSFSEPLVATGPGVREPQNRRAVIDLGYNVTAALAPSDGPQH